MRNELVTTAVLTISLFVFVTVGLGAATGGEVGALHSTNTEDTEATTDEIVSESVVLQAGAEFGATASDDDPEGSVTTEYFEIWYYAGYQDEAEEIATYADDYYEIIFQKFGVAPFDDTETVVVGDLSDIPCEGEGVDGCYNSGTGNMYVTNDDPGLFYHELTHRYQDVSGVVQPGGQSPLEIVVEGTARQLDSPSDQIATGATFTIDKDEYFTNRDADGSEYEDLALFSEFVLHDYGREAFDVLYTESWVWPGSQDELEAATGEDVASLQEEFIDQLPQQEQRLQSGGTTLPAFTYDTFYVKPDEEVTFDARTPDAIEELDRTWYPETPTSYEWDLTGDGEIDGTGPTVSTTDPAGTVTLYVTMDGETYEAEQDLLTQAPDLSVASTAVDETTLADGESVTVTVSVENSGEDPGSESFDLLVDDDVVETQTVEVADGETVDLTFEHEFDEQGTYEIAVDQEHVEEIDVLGPADVELTDLSFESEQFAVDEEIVIEATAQNTGASEGEVDFRVSGDEHPLLLVDSRVFEVPGEEIVTEEFEFDWQVSPGTYEVELDGEPETVSVYDPAEVGLVETDLSAETVTPGEPVTVSAVIENSGEVAVNQTVDIDLDTEQIHTETITVEGGGTEEITLEHSFVEPGTYTFTIDDTFEESITVETESDSDEGASDADETTRDADDGTADADNGTEDTDDGIETTDDDDDDDTYDGDDFGPGFGFTTLFVGLGATGYLLKRRLDTNESE